MTYLHFVPKYQLFNSETQKTFAVVSTQKNGNWWTYINIYIFFELSNAFFISMAKRVPFQINLFQIHKTWQCARKTICILGKINEVVLHFERQRLVNMIFDKTRFFFLLKYLYRKFNFWRSRFTSFGCMWKTHIKINVFEMKSLRCSSRTLLPPPPPLLRIRILKILRNGFCLLIKILDMFAHSPS